MTTLPIAPLASTESATTRRLLLALDAASLRHRVIESNIANVNTPGHVARRVDFDGLMAAGDSALGAHLTIAPDRDGLPAGVNLDVEVAAMAQNTLHQQALLRALQRHLGLLSLAATEGRR